MAKTLYITQTYLVETEVELPEGMEIFKPAGDGGEVHTEEFADWIAKQADDAPKKPLQWSNTDVIDEEGEEVWSIG